MIKTGRYNNLTPTLIPKLKKGQRAIFVSIHNTKDESGNGLYPTYSIPATDQVYDEVKEEWVDIALIKKEGAKDGPPEFENIAFESQKKGVIVLSGDSASDVRLYEYLMLCNYNVSNEKRNKSAFGIFKVVNNEADAVQSLKNAQKERDAVNFAMDTPLDELRIKLQSRGIKNTDWSEERVRARAIEEAKKEPFTAIPQKGENLVSTATIQLEALVKEAYEADLIFWDHATGYMKHREKGTAYFKVPGATKDKVAKLLAAASNDEQILKLLYTDLA